MGLNLRVNVNHKFTFGLLRRNTKGTLIHIIGWSPGEETLTVVVLDDGRPITAGLQALTVEPDVCSS